MSKFILRTNKKKSQNSCKICGKKRAIDSEHCDSCKLKHYLSGIAELKTMQSLSSYSLITDESNKPIIPDELKHLQELHKKIVMSHNTSSSSAPDDGTPDKNVYVNMKRINKYRGTFTKLQRKMRNIEKFYPEIYNDKQDIISMWSSYQLQDTLDLNKLEFCHENFLWY